MTASYDYILVGLSVFIGMFAAYAAMDLADRVRVARGWWLPAWFMGGAVAAGIGIWSMHFTGMLAFSLPVPVDYDWPAVLQSLAAGIFAAGVSLFLLSREKTRTVQIVFAGFVVGTAIITVHNVGMHAMRMAAEFRYDVRLASLAVVLAIVLSFGALWLGFHFRDEKKDGGWKRIVGALIAGAAISSIHYCALAATIFVPSAPDLERSHAIHISTVGAAAIGLATLAVQGFAMLTSFADRRFAAGRVAQLSNQLIDVHDETRRRIARDLHDDVGQGLYAIKLRLGRLRQSVVESTTQMSLSEVVDMISASMEKVRTIAQVLYPPELERLGLRSAIVVYVDAFRDHSGIPVELNITSPLPRLSRECECTLLRVVQECLLNVVRHSRSRNVKIQIRTVQDRLVLEVSDDGCGIVPELLHKLQIGMNSGIGIASMHSRIEELGGHLEITSGSCGTSVKTIVPLTSKPN